MIIAVYGSLRKGLGNSPLLSDSEFLGKYRCRIPYRMVSLGGYPGLIESPEVNDITLEVYDVPEDSAQRIDRLEGYPGWYDRTEIQVGNHTAWVYHFKETDGYNNNPPVPNGDWMEYITECI